MKKLLNSVVLMLPFMVLALLVWRVGSVPAAELGPGCDPTRTAVAYHAGGTALTSHHGNLPIPCAVVTGSTMETATVGVTSRGTLFYAPQSTGAAVAPAVTRSRDDGATWDVKPRTLRPGTGSAIPWMHVDPQTNRIWFAMIGPVPSTCPASDVTLAHITWRDRKST